MSVKVYVNGANNRGAAAACEWLRRLGLTPVTPVTTEEWAATVRERLAACEIAVFFARPKLTGVAGRRADCEIGLALGLGKRVLVVGPPESPLHHESRVERHASWREAEAVFASHFHGTPLQPAPQGVPSPDAAEYALRFWAANAEKIVTIPKFIDTYAPGVASRAVAHSETRLQTYLAVKAAWRSAGSPRAFADVNESGVSPDAAAFSDHAAVTEWFTHCVRLAEIDRDRSLLAAEKDTILRATRPKRRPPPGGSTC